MEIYPNPLYNTEMDTFNPESFARLRQAEREHFWFSVRRRHIYDRIKRLAPPQAGMLEVGCGTGNVSSYLSSKGFKVTGCEYFPHALELAYKNFTKTRGDALYLPFKDNSFDIVALFDVIEHLNDDNKAVEEAYRVVKKGGVVAVTVPARKELWSYADEKALHRRRYTKDMLGQAFCKAGLTPILIEYMFMSLYLPMRFARRKNKKNTDQFKISILGNALFNVLLSIERLISKFITIPIGTSIIAIARKKS